MPTDIVKELDEWLQSLGFVKIADLDQSKLKLNEIEQCASCDGGLTGCSVEVSKAIKLLDVAPIGEFVIYIEIEAVAWATDNPQNCTVDIEVNGETETGKINMYKFSVNACVAEV